MIKRMGHTRIKVTKYSAQLIIEDQKKFITNDFIQKHDQYDKYAIEGYSIDGTKQTVSIRFWERPTKTITKELGKIGELFIEKNIHIYNRFP